MMTTFFTFSLLIMNLCVRRALDVVTGDDAEERRRRLRVARLWSGTCASPTARCARSCLKYVVLDAATAPEVDGPSTPSTLLSPTYFCASVCAGAGALFDRRVAEHELDLEPELGASVLTAYFAQAPCSAPRKPAPPVTGVTSGRVMVLLQLTLAADAAATF